MVLPSLRDGNTSYLVHLPSDESLGYFRVSLRDKDVGNDKAFTPGERAPDPPFFPSGP